MTESIETSSDIFPLIEWLTNYLLVDESPDSSSNVTHNGDEKSTTQNVYQLPLGQLRVLKINPGLSSSDTKTNLEATRLAAIKFALRWKKRLLKQDKIKQITSAYVLVLEIDSSATSDNLVTGASEGKRLSHSFGAQYAIDNLATDTEESGSALQVFNWQDWQTMLVTLQTPCELWRLLQYHKAALQQSFLSAKPTFDSEQVLLTQFMHSNALYAQAISVDNALIKYGMQDEPNTTLVAMSLAQNNVKDNTKDNAKSYHQQMAQTAALWAQLSTQMLSESLIETRSSQVQLPENQSLKQQLRLWQQLLLDESLFSRHELIRTIYQYPQSSFENQQSGYVVHQHSYEHLGRHYVFIFYGKAANSKQNRAAIAPNLAKIADDVSLRIPIAELHQIIVLGVEFIDDGRDTFIDLDLFIQPVVAMSAKERQLTRQLQRLSQQKSAQSLNNNAASKQRLETQSTELPSIQLNINIPSNKN